MDKKSKISKSLVATKAVNQEASGILNELVFNNRVKEYVPAIMKPSKETWEEMGFIFEEVTNGNRAYVMTAPDKWKFEITSNEKVVNIVDNYDNIRGTIDYGNSSMNLHRYYGIYHHVIGKDGHSKEIYFGTKEEAKFVAGHVPNVNHSSSDKRLQLHELEHRYEMLAEKYGEDYFPGWKKYDTYWKGANKLTEDNVKVLGRK